MRKLIALNLLLAGFICLGTVSCGGGGGASDSSPGDNGPTVGNTAPVADAGQDQITSVDNLVSLNGSGSFDAEGGITYMWSFVSMPAGSAAALDDSSLQNPAFTADVKGSYVLNLSVNDGELTSEPDYVTVTARSWGGVEIIDAGQYDAHEPQVAFDSGGNALAVWIQGDGTYDSIYANRYDAASGIWQGTAAIDAGDYDASYPQVTVDPYGNAFAVWCQKDDINNTIYANRYDAGSGLWQGAVELESGANNALYPQVAFDPGGNAFATWVQNDGEYSSIYVNRYDAGSGAWQGAQEIDAGDYHSTDPQVAFDSSGNAIAVWKQNEAATYNVYANYYDAGSGTWQGAELIESNDYIAYDPQVALDSNGNALVVWQQRFGTYASIYANRYDARLGIWQGAALIDAGDYDAKYPQVALDPDGNAFAIWNQNNGSYDNIYINRYDAESKAWQGAVIIDNGTDNAQYPQIGFDSNGNAIAVWRQLDDSYYYRLHANRYDSASGVWEGAEVIDEGINSVTTPQVAVDSTGNAIAVFRQRDGAYFNIYANRYD